MIVKATRVYESLRNYPRIVERECFRWNNNANNVSQSGQLHWGINDASVRDMHDRLQ